MFIKTEKSITNRISSISLAFSNNVLLLNCKSKIVTVTVFTGWLLYFLSARPLLKTLNVQKRWSKGVNSLLPGDAIWRQGSRSTLVQASSHYQNQCWLIIIMVQWRSSEDNFAWDITAISHNNELENYFSKISLKSSRGQWVNTLKPRQKGRYFVDDIFKMSFDENCCILIQISSYFFCIGTIYI